jgi:hypothetical protein
MFVEKNTVISTSDFAGAVATLNRRLNPSADNHRTHEKVEALLHVQIDDLKTSPARLNRAQRRKPLQDKHEMLFFYGQGTYTFSALIEFASGRKFRGIVSATASNKYEARAFLVNRLVIEGDLAVNAVTLELVRFVPYKDPVVAFYHVLGMTDIVSVLNAIERVPLTFGIAA